MDDAARLFDRVLDNGAAMLFEGGQTTYPFVSSSNATADGARVGRGAGPARDARAPSSGGRRGIRSRLSRLVDMLPTAV
ncbi:MAG: adenylosuccinate synthetase [Aeriscardovia sp.]|nr:adenylosuccinate synthetase [Aeriscardovia sp.]